ncbi:uncharacterized protein BDZ83DRAFT_163002 [Colletotrichum acutatum]|uniref:Uncharacterized protein n=1 Tax=Glomerella acutata TaxID=27357 RepID=A0AAD8XPZ6_GLOAC|nr:uncharacterized protein BDZ83DRAFT_163002 [Colletotrichum acutatum]KAK1731555.1 hypothetical protein BDZ83DRAFT_163002 [Colletotrichum acutatum]
MMEFAWSRRRDTIIVLLVGPLSSILPVVPVKPVLPCAGRGRDPPTAESMEHESQVDQEHGPSRLIKLTTDCRRIIEAPPLLLTAQRHKCRVRKTYASQKISSPIPLYSTSRVESEYLDFDLHTHRPDTPID